MFQYVNEVAVIGTTFFMMALTVLWYSEYLFQKIWLRAISKSKNEITPSTAQLQKNLLVMFGTYLAVVYVIAVVVGYAQVYGVGLEKIIMLMVIGFASLVSGLLVWEQRSLGYYAVILGFSTVFIVSSSFFLYHWPW